jgi:transcriptional regulator with XRE-family HTH domain
MPAMREDSKTTLYDIVGDKVREKREANKLSQKELASEIGISRSSVVNIENGRQHTPLHVLWKMSDVFGIHVSELLPSKAELDSKTPSLSEYKDDPELKKVLEEFIESAPTGD